MEDEAEKTGIIYCRVSSQEQVQGTSLDMQKRLCEEYAAREGIKVLSVFIEEGESAKTANRTQFQKALAMCASKKPMVDFFIVHKIDRFARNQDDHVVTQTMLKRSGTKLRSVTEHIDETPIGRAMEGMLSVFAELDNNVRSARSKSGMEERVKAGVWVWSAPLGYMRLIKGGNLVVDDATAPYVRMAFEEWAKGTHSYKSLSTFLGERGFRTRAGKKPCPQLIEKIIRNPIYCGVMSVWGHEYKGAFPPLIDEELFVRCQPGVRRKFGPGKREKENPNFPLRKFALCAECGHALTGSSTTGGRGKKYPYYHHQKQGCVSAKAIPKETFEQEFVELLQELSPSGKYEASFRAIVLDIWQSNYKKLDAENARVRKEIEGLEVERQRVFDLHRAGTYSDEDFQSQKRLVNEKIQSKKLFLEDKRVEEFNMEEALDYCFSFVRESAKTWLELKDAPIYRTRFQKQAFPQKVTYDGKEFGTKNPSLVYKLNQPVNAETSNLVSLQSLEWNTIEDMVIKWNTVFRSFGMAERMAI